MVTMENLKENQIEFLIANSLTPNDLRLEETGRMASGVTPEVADMETYELIKSQFVNQYGVNELTENFVDYLFTVFGLS